MKCCVYTKCFKEDPYFDFFIEHYLKLGFDKIIILKNDNIKYRCLEQYNNSVIIHNVDPMPTDLLANTHKNLVINSNYDWILHVDMDEILLLHKNIKEYIKEKLIINNNINQFYFRWAMIEKLDIKTNISFKDILNNYKIFNNTHIKSLSKRINIRGFTSHCTSPKAECCIYFEGNILNKNKDVYHKIIDNTYKDSILIHLHTRSIHNIIMKIDNNMYPTTKKIDITVLSNLINNFSNNNNDIVAMFRKCIGYKANLPYSHKKEGEISTIKFNKFIIYNYKYNVINEKIEKEYILNLLKHRNINIEKYNQFVNKLEPKIIKDFIK